MKKDLGSLVHIQKDIKGGGEVFVLDNGAVIDSESDAMIQALHSRSIGGFKHHLDVLEKKGPEDFMKNFYVGYGHKSIGDCGSTTIFIEGVSMLVAKAIQDTRLYNGQEASTRFMDFSKQKFINPLGTEEAARILESEREFYLSILGPLVQHLRSQNPRQENEKESVYEKAINARAFDIARGFLPAGASTNLSWHSNLRQVADRLLFLRHHPLEEVRNTALAIEEAVIEAHPNSFSTKRYPETEEYQDVIARSYLYHDSRTPEIEIADTINTLELNAVRSLLDKRPPKTELPKFLSGIGRISSRFKLDFGSFRDIHRQRAINQKMPLLTTDIGFNQWYLDNLPEEARVRAEEFLGDLEVRIKATDTPAETRQYYTPMGYNTSNLIEGDVPAMVYFVELRATRFVHPTLSTKARKIGEYMQEKLGFPVYLDDEMGRFDIKRGEQDIIIK